ncbi:hypothetical protein CI741_27130 [Klebsiella pneumoniae subsp. pneumoniae]|nr:DUF551 domain-containing protein [Klebsiella pneumoniae]OYI90693.1 hypothetical protein CI741_27130 [Klebsiella pneumoniae subsp. pneumoniae]
MTKSTITRERLQRIMRAIDSESYDEEEIREWLSSDEIMELSRMALVAMDSEPVAWLLSGGGTKNVVCFDSGNAYADPLREVTPLYRHAQPAPVVQCPYPCGWDNLNKLAIQDAALVARGLVEGEPTTEAQRQAAISNNDRLLKVISACRAAMLAAAQQLPGSENAAVPGKWIPVSERMPEDEEQYYLTYSEGDGVCRSYFFDGYFADQYITHWMPLPAAPQEVR